MNANLVFLHGSHRSRCDTSVDKHFVNYSSLQFMSRGAIEIRYDRDDEGEFDVLNGSWFWAAYPGPRVVFHPAPRTRTWDHRYVAFTGTIANDWLAEGLLPRTPQPAPQGRDWATRFDEMLSLTTANTPLATRLAVNRLEGILLELANARTTMSQPPPPWLDEVLTALRQSPGEPIDYEALARQAGMGQSTLRRRFREVTGTSLHHYRIDSRITEARRLLTETDTPIAAIAHRLGYSDVYAFSNQFRDRPPPGRFRQSRQP